MPVNTKKNSNSETTGYKQLLILFGVTVLIIVLILIVLLVSDKPENDDFLKSNPPNSSAILTLLSEYGDTSAICDKTLKKLNMPMQATVFKTEEIEIRLREVIYDGVWLYTAAEIESLAPDKVLVMPGAADVTDSRTGVNGERTVADNRSFIDAANDDGKKLLAVYVYPKEFDSLNEYFLDYRQLSENSSLCFSGARIGGDNQYAPITWSVQVYEVNTTQGHYSLLTTIESEQQWVSPVETVISQEYELDSDQVAPFTRVRLIKSGITTYIQAYSATDKPYSMHSMEVYTSTGERIIHGAALESCALSLNEFPDSFVLSLEDGKVYVLKMVDS